MKPQCSSRHSQVPATCTYPQPNQSSSCPHIPLPEDPSLILSSHLRLGLPSDLFPSRFPTKTLYTSLVYTPRPSHYFRYYHQNNIWWAVQIMKPDNWPYPEPDQSSPWPAYGVINPLILNVDTTLMWLVSLRRWPIYPHFESLPIHNSRKLISPQSKSRYFEEEKSLLPRLRFEIRFLQPIDIVGLYTQFYWLFSDNVYSFELFYIQLSAKNKQNKQNKQMSPSVLP